MLDTDTPPRSSLVRALGWAGLWLCTASSLPLLTVWMQSFNPRRPLHLPPVGSSLLWGMIGLDALMASLVVFSQWQEAKKPKKRRPAPTPTNSKDRLRPWLAGAALAGFLILRILAANPGASVNWAGVGSGLLAQGLLFYLISVCTKLTQPSRTAEDIGEGAVGLAPGPGWSPVAGPSLPALGVRPPRNRCRGEVNTREAVYRRSTFDRMSAVVGMLFFAGMTVGAVWITLLSLGLIVEPGMRTHDNPALALMMGGGSVFFVCAFFSLLSLIGPRELRVSPSDHTYTYRLAAPVRSSFLASIISSGSDGRETLQAEMGLPWRTVEYKGGLEDMAGIKRLETTSKSTTTYSLSLCWRDPSRPPMRVGFARTQDQARALQVQAADDLGVGLLPDEVA